MRTLQTNSQLCRMGLVACITWALVACGGGRSSSDNDGPPEPPTTKVAPATPQAPSLAYGVKRIDLSWPAVSGATTYEIGADPDGPGGAQDIESVAIGLTSTAYSRIGIALHLHLNVHYSLRACNGDACSDWSALAAPDLKQMIGYFKGAPSAAGDQFGSAVALSQDGRTLAVGAPYQNGSPGGIAVGDAGVVYVFVRADDNTQMWTQQAVLHANDAAPGNQFGTAISLSANGNRLVVTASLERSVHQGIISGSDLQPEQAEAEADEGIDTGAAYVFDRITGSWIQSAYIKASDATANTYFGSSAALSGDGLTLAVGAYAEDNGGNDSGAVYVFKHDGSNWSEQIKIKAPNAGEGDLFGVSVALSHDGLTLAVGAPWEAGSAGGIDPNPDDSALGAGAVYVFTYNPGASTWNVDSPTYIKDNAPAANRLFGLAVALSANGGHSLAVSTIDAGVYMFTRSAGIWSQQDHIQSGNEGQVVNAVALSADGHSLAIGALLEPSPAQGVSAGELPGSNAIQAGAAYLYRLSGTTWSKVSNLKSTHTAAGQSLGYAVALSGDGQTLAAGAPGESSSSTGVSAGGSGSNNSAGAAGAVFLY